MGMPGSAAGNEFVDYYSLSLLNEICGVSSKRGGSGSMRLFLRHFRPVVWSISFDPVERR